MLVPQCDFWEGTIRLPRRRRFLHLTAGAIALPAVSQFAWAQAYPTRPVRVVVGFPAGQTADITARLDDRFLETYRLDPLPSANESGY